MIYFFFIWAIGLIYFAILMKSAITFRRMGSSKSENRDSNISFSVIIPFRNENNRIEGLLSSLKLLDYPGDLVEFFFIDDHSDDNTSGTIKNLLNNSNLNYSILQNPGQGKKDALTSAIKAAQFEWIITTDADCVIPSDWLLCYAKTISQSDVKLIAGPVVYEATKPRSFIQNYQVVENAGLVVFTASAIQSGQPLTANGANLCFSKAGFFEVNGYDGNRHIASGDDEFLLEKFSNHYPGQIQFLKNQNALVRTLAEATFSHFIAQRVRWAGKSAARKNYSTRLFQVLILLWYISIIAAFPIEMILYGKIWFATVAIIFKMIVDYIFYISIRKFFNLTIPQVTILLFSISQLFIIPYIGIKTLGGKISWKGRKYQM